MTESGAVVVVGGSAGLGLEVGRHYAERGRTVVVSSRDQARADAAATDIGGETTGISVDLAEPDAISDALAGIGAVDYLVLAAIERDENTVRDLELAAATRLVTLKLVGYVAAVNALLPRMTETSSIVLFGGMAKDRPYPGSTFVSTVNGGITGMVTTMASELAPIRVNAIHPAVVGDSPYWRDKPPAVLDALRERTPTGRLVAMADIVDAVVFLLENNSVNGIDLRVDGGWLVK
jgi:NAD(P)-dependent dehydrogenase (short-subunit alcohol dehydrogenase family)